MNRDLGLLASWRWLALKVPIYQRIAIGNALIIIIGATGGTLITRLLTDVAADIWLIVLFTVAGSALSITTNNWIIRTALRPLYRLRGLVDRAAAGHDSINLESLADGDPDIEQLTNALNSLVLQLQERNRQLRALTERSIHMQEEERKRIARCLHDDTGQSLSSLIIALQRLEDRLPEDPGELQQRLSTLHQLAKHALEELRVIISGLRPTILDDLGLVPAIRWYARTNLEPKGVDVKVFSPGDDLQLPAELATTLFRISQEAVNNVLRHAQAKVVMITLNQDEVSFTLQVMDDGLGFDLHQASNRGPDLEKLGLLGIQERVDLVGGQMTIDTAPGHGTRLFVQLPVQNAGVQTNG